MIILKETIINNSRLRKNYKCNEETDYYNRAGHDCYYNNDYSMITTLLIGTIVIVIIILIVYLLKKRKEKQIKVKVEEKVEEIRSKGKINRS